MADNFSAGEFLKIAISIEENGQKLYGDLEAKAKDQTLKNLWAHLKAQEEIHRKVFQDMLDNVGDYIIHEFNPGEYQNYIRAIASEYVFTQDLMDKKLREGFSSDIEAIEFAISIEKDSILVYSSLREYIIANRQLVLDKVINEERKHFGELTSVKESMKKGD